MATTWFISDKGEPINLAYVIKVQWGGDWTAPTADQQKMVVIYHSADMAPSTSKGTVTAYKYNSAAEAKASRDRLVALLLALDMATDLRTPATEITSITPATAVAGVATTIVVAGPGATNSTTSGFLATGTGFKSTGKIVINGVDHTITWLSPASISFTTDTSIAAGTYDVIYTDPEGNAAVLSPGITLT